MSRNNLPFRFKKFTVSHHRSSMKVGFDAVVLGAWATRNEVLKRAPGNILDVGCGCGVIAMMMAQKYTEANIVGIDVDQDSVEECRANFMNSDWTDRLKVEEGNFIQYSEIAGNAGIEFDIIISNPPYFSAGVISPDNPRLIARHQSILTPTTFIQASKDILSSYGSIFVVIPSEQVEELAEYCDNIDLRISSILVIKDRSNSVSKRTLLKINHINSPTSFQKKILIVKEDNGNYTRDYISLCRDYYLNF